LPNIGKNWGGFLDDKAQGSWLNLSGHKKVRKEKDLSTYLLIPDDDLVRSKRVVIHSIRTRMMENPVYVVTFAC
jgi:hypothetical protein